MAKIAKNIPQIVKTIGITLDAKLDAAPVIVVSQSFGN